MKISELRINQGSVEVTGVISEVGETRVFSKFGKDLKVANSILTDDSGSIKLTLWNDDVARFSNGDKIKIINGYVGEYQGEKQLTSGKFGRMEKVSGEDNSSDDTSEIKKEIESSEAKSKKAIVTKRDLKKKNEETLEVYGEELDEIPSDEEVSEEDLF